MGLIRLILRLLGALFRPLFSAALDDLDDGFSGLNAGDSTISTGAFRDTARARTIPFKLYAPDDPEDAPDPGPRPVVIFSHGLGGSRDAAPYLGEALSRNGYYAFFIQHPGSDASILDGVKSRDEVMQRLRAVMQNPGNAPDRFRDLHVVIDQMHLMNAPDGPLAGKLDLEHIGMAGHSYGARSVLTAAGQRMGMYGTPFKDSRVRAGIALSPNLPTQMMRQELHTVAHAQHRQASIQQEGHQRWCTGGIDAFRAAGQDERLWLMLNHLVRARIMREDFRVDAQLTHASCDQLGVLRTIIQNGRATLA